MRLYTVKSVNCFRKKLPTLEDALSPFQQNFRKSVENISQNTPNFQSFNCN